MESTAVRKLFGVGLLGAGHRDLLSNLVPRIKQAEGQGRGTTVRYPTHLKGLEDIEFRNSKLWISVGQVCP